MIDAVLLDWENILVATSAIRHEALLRALADEGVPTDDAAYHPLCDGRTVHQAAANMLGHVSRRDPTLVEIVTLRAQRFFLEHLQQGTILLPGAREFLERLQIRTRIGIVTGASYSETETMLHHANLHTVVNTVISTDDVMTLPPAPDVYLKSLEQLRRLRAVQLDRVVVLATSALALRSARSAALRTVAIGASAHISVEADGAAGDVHGITFTELARLAGIAMAERGQ